jgi:hypothetical protein
MKDPVEWDEVEVASLIQNQVQESLTLDYKRSDALGKTEAKRNELSKDVSAFANSAGGVILYGMAEDKHFPIKTDDGLDPNEISKEWIEQVVNSSIHPKIDGLRVNQISLCSKGSGKVLYAIYVPAATSRAPHQAKDKRYYKRYNFECVPMEDYEIRDIYRRASTPDLWLEFRFEKGDTEKIIFQPETSQSDAISLRGIVGNRSREPALYAVIRIYLDAAFTLVSRGGFTSSGVAEYGRRPLNVISKNWGIPGNLPIFSEQTFAVSDPPVSFSLTKEALDWPDFLIGYDIRAPGFADSKIFRVVHQPRGTLWIVGEAKAPN